MKVDTNNTLHQKKGFSWFRSFTVIIALWGCQTGQCKDVGMCWFLFVSGTVWIYSWDEWACWLLRSLTCCVLYMLLSACWSVMLTDFFLGRAGKLFSIFHGPHRGAQCTWGCIQPCPDASSCGRGGWSRGSLVGVSYHLGVTHSAGSPL